MYLGLFKGDVGGLEKSDRNSSGVGAVVWAYPEVFPKRQCLVIDMITSLVLMGSFEKSLWCSIALLEFSFKTLCHGSSVAGCVLATLCTCQPKITRDHPCSTSFRPLPHFGQFKNAHQAWRFTSPTEPCTSNRSIESLDSNIVPKIPVIFSISLRFLGKQFSLFLQPTNRKGLRE